MPRAYLRNDPYAFQRKVIEDGYTAAQFAAFQAVLCLAAFQDPRGSFVSERLLRLLLDEPSPKRTLKWGRHVPFLIANGDLDIRDDGSIGVVGWQEWQEGDYTVPDRMARIRARQRGERGETVTPPAVSSGTVRDTAADTPSLRGRARAAVSVSGGDISGGGRGSRGGRMTPARDAIKIGKGTTTTDDDRPKGGRTAQEILADPDASEEAKAGARAWVDLFGPQPRAGAADAP